MTWNLLIADIGAPYQGDSGLRRPFPPGDPPVSRRALGHLWDDVDQDLIALRRTSHHQLGFAVQMCTARYVGGVLVDDPLDVPWSVGRAVVGGRARAAQLGIEARKELWTTPRRQSWATTSRRQSLAKAV
nr:DUF4158 domain-containing protein [Streptomyces sp. A1-5]